MRPARVRLRSLEDCLMADTGVARLSAHARRLLKLQRIFESATPLARQSRVANLKLGRIVIFATNGAVAAKLRQIAPRLTAAFRSEAAEVTGIDFRVQPATAQPPASPAASPATIGRTQKQALTSLIAGLPDGSALKAALVRLVDRC